LYVENNNLLCCGSNRHNELGLILESDRNCIELLTDIKSPLLNTHIKNVKSVQCGFKHTIFICENYLIYGSGDNSKGVLGLGFHSKENESRIIKKEIMALTNLNDIVYQNINEEIKKIKCGWNNTFILTSIHLLNI